MSFLNPGETYEALGRRINTLTVQISLVEDQMKGIQYTPLRQELNCRCILIRGRIQYLQRMKNRKLPSRPQ